MEEHTHRPSFYLFSQLMFRASIDLHDKGYSQQRCRLARVWCCRPETVLRTVLVRGGVFESNIFRLTGPPQLRNPPIPLQSPLYCTLFNTLYFAICSPICVSLAAIQFRMCGTLCNPTCALLFPISFSFYSLQSRLCPTLSNPSCVLLFSIPHVFPRSDPSYVVFLADGNVHGIASIAIISLADWIGHRIATS